MKRMVSFLAAIAISVSMIGVTNVSASDYVVYFQNGGQAWSNHPYGIGSDNEGYDYNATIATSGCGVMSLVNALYYLNGEFIQPTELADFSMQKGCRVNKSGTADCIVEHAAVKFGGKYGFKAAGSTQNEYDLINGLNSGKKVVWHAPGHFMAIVEYNWYDNTFLVIDSLPSKKRGTYNYGYDWKTFSEINNIGFKGEGLMFIEKAEKTDNSTYILNGNNPVLTWPAVSNIKTYVTSTYNNTTVYETPYSYSNYGTIYANDLITINGCEGSRLSVTYPVSWGEKSGYIDIADVTRSGFNSALAQCTAYSYITVYRRSSGYDTLGTVYYGDVYYEIDHINNRTQIIYPVSGGYKMGWIDSTSSYSSNNSNSLNTSNNSSAFLYASKIESFINDYRWRVGTYWGPNQTPLLYNNLNHWGCNSYVNDFTYYVYNKSVYDGTPFYNASEIKSGDVLYVTPEHWMVVLNRIGNDLDIIHGNWTNGTVCRKTYTLYGNTIGDSGKTFVYGYHYY